MNRTIIFSTLVLSFLLVITSCKNTKQGTDKITFDSIVIKEHVQLFEVNDSTLPYADVSISFLYPKQFKSNEDLARLQEIFIGTFFKNVNYDKFTPQVAVDKYMEDYRESYKALSIDYNNELERLPEGSSAPMWYWYYMNLNNEIAFENQSLLSYGTHYSDYTGGAHGSYNISYTNIDLENLTTISEEDLFIPNYPNKLAEIIVNRLMIQNNITERDSLLEIGYFNIEEIYPNNNFWIDANGINYAFNQYEIAPYVMGVTEVHIPFEDLAGILAPSNPIDKIFAK